MPELPELLSKLATGASLSEIESKTAFEIVMDGQSTPTQIGALLMGMRVRGETVDEIAGAVGAMRSKATMIVAPPNAIDTAGTGGDGIGTFNISTCAALVAAACGVPVAKHGNRAISSKSGSADVLSTLGVNIEASMEVIQECLWSIGIGFLMAPRHHGAMRTLVRAESKLALERSSTCWVHYPIQPARNANLLEYSIVLGACRWQKFLVSLARPMFG